MDLPFFSRTASAVPRFHTLQRDQLVRLGVQWSRAQLKQMGEMWDFYSGRKSGEERNTSMNISNCRIMGLMPCARVLSPIQEVEGRRMNGRIRLARLAMKCILTRVCWISVNLTDFQKRNQPSAKMENKWWGSKNQEMVICFMAWWSAKNLLASPFPQCWSSTTEAEAWSAKLSGLPGVQSQLGCSMASGGPMKPMFHGHSSA